MGQALQDRGPAHAGAEPTGLTVVTLAQRPDLAAAARDVLAAGRPAYMLRAVPGHRADLWQLLTHVPRHQVLLIDGTDRVLGAGLSLPLTWDRTVDGLPAGWDATVAAAAGLARCGGTANAVATLSVTTAPPASGRGLAAGMLRALLSAAATAGIEAVISPVRPVLKARYPLTTMAAYLRWRTPADEPFDPWIRQHVRLGGVQVRVAYSSRTLRGTVGQWQEWTQMPLPSAGEYVLPGALAPLTVDRRADLATYREPHVWFVHRATC